MKSFFKGIAILLFAVLMGCCLGCFSSLWANTQAYLTTPISIAVIAGGTKADFDSKLAPLLQDQIKQCAACSFQNITPYDADGNVNLKAIPDKIEAARPTSSFLFMHWNAKVTEDTKPILASLKKVTQDGWVVIGSAGMAQNEEPTLNLNKTVLGQVAGLIIIGDLAERERLLTKSYFGPEMLTALRPPDEYVGQGISSVFFASKLAANWNKRTSKDWLAYFQTTKAKVRRIWPSLEDFFGR
jgi:hypothetical protein